MNLIKEIYKNAKALESCNRFKGNEDLEGIVKLMFSPQGIEFCVKHNFPPLEYFEEFDNELLEELGVFVNAGTIEIENKENVFLVGNTDAVLSYNNVLKGYKVVLMHRATAKIYADNYAVVFVFGDTDNAEISAKNHSIVK